MGDSILELQMIFHNISFQTLMNVRPASITVARSSSAKTPKGHFVVFPQSIVVVGLFRMPWATVSVIFLCQYLQCNKFVFFKTHLYLL